MPGESAMATEGGVAGETQDILTYPLSHTYPTKMQHLQHILEDADPVCPQNSQPVPELCTCLKQAGWLAAVEGPMSVLLSQGFRWQERLVVDPGPPGPERPGLRVIWGLIKSWMEPWSTM